MGTKKIVFTGGEPLVRPDVIKLVRYAKKLGYIVTLSTNTLLLKQKWKILDFIDQIGIPIDGSNKEINSSIRVGNPIQFDTALFALDTIKKDKPGIEITVRTVVNKKNINDITNINNLLEKYINKFDRWKIYQFAPANYGAINSNLLSINKTEFLTATNKAEDNSKIVNIKKYLKENRPNRYVFIGSDGDVYGINILGEYQSVGNVINDELSEITINLSKIYNDKTKRD